jgi:aspartyl-tRNA synthetase
MGHSPQDQQAQFSGILEALEFGAPPHGGIALGVDRWIALLTEQSNIREVMAFPKTSSGSDLMLEAPSPVASDQLEELGLMLRPQSVARP